MFPTTYFPSHYFAPRYFPIGGEVMTTHITRADTLIVSQITTLTPTAVNSATYGVTINDKGHTAYTADGSATVQEIVEGLVAILEDITIPEYVEATYTEDNTKVIATGDSLGTPFTIVDASGGGGSIAVSTTTEANSPNHWDLKNFDTQQLPGNGDTVIITKLTEEQSIKYNLDQSAVTLALLEIRADSNAVIGLSDINTESTSYYQVDYRETHLKISATAVRIGEGQGTGSRMIRLNLGTAQTDVTIYSTSSQSLNFDEAPVHLLASNVSNTLQIFNGFVDLGMLASSTSSQWDTIIQNGGSLRCGKDVTLATLEIRNCVTETRKAVTTVTVRENATLTHFAGDITTLNISNTVILKGRSAITITTLNAYSDAILDLSECDSVVTITNMNIYADRSNPFVIKDPNNKLTMTNAASVFNGVSSISFQTGNGRNVRIS